jgi:hypothetical protein
MSSIVYEGEHYKDIFSKGEIVKQLKQAIEDIENNETNIIVVVVSSLKIEIDESENEITVIA